MSRELTILSIITMLAVTNQCKNYYWLLQLSLWKEKKKEKENLHIYLQKYALFFSGKQYSMRRDKCES